MTTRREFLLAAAAPAFQLVETANEKIAFRRGGTLWFEYRFSKSRPKTYVHPLCAPGGRVLTLDGPADHIHHRGLMLAWSDVNGYDFWGETNPAPHGGILHQRFLRRRSRPPELAALNHWIAGGSVLLAERRTLRAPAITDDAVWLEWESELRAVSGAVVLSARKSV
ncbi:MAG: PmoA family protein, partial [Bryobacteraceae bacterium]|nr:PmoA family protein [Bryobacteraceae bacterium]